MSAGVLDLLLVAGLLGLAGVLLFGAGLFRAIVLFIVFGLLMALTWARLNAPDLALAEAAVGAGVTGALVLAAWRRVAREPAPSGGRRWLLPVAAGLGVGVVVVATVAALTGMGPAVGLEGAVASRLAESGVRHPVTAVLLNFRGYDTLLEFGVLLLAAVAVRLLAGGGEVVTGEAGPVLERFAALLTPLLIVTAGYLLWRGGHAPGGAFQAGALLAAAGILLVLVVPGVPGSLSEGRVRAGLVLGPFLFLAVAAGAAVTGSLLEYPRPWAGTLILLVEAAGTLSIAAALWVQFVGIASAREGGP